MSRLYVESVKQVITIFGLIYLTHSTPLADFWKSKNRKLPIKILIIILARLFESTSYELTLTQVKAKSGPPAEIPGCPQAQCQPSLSSTLSTIPRTKVWASDSAPLGRGPQGPWSQMRTVSLSTSPTHAQQWTSRTGARRGGA
jgi:hypothetical protein